MKPIRVMIVDDSIVVRRTITQALSTEPQIEVVGEASNGLEALRNVPTCRPDIVVLDLIMPQMDGLTTLLELQRFHPTLPVIIFSSCSTADARVTVEALANGAADYCPKPRSSDGFMASVRTIQNELLAKIRAITDAHRRLKRSPMSAKASAQAKRRRTAVIPPGTRGIVIGSSTGGPNALEYLLSAIPEHFPCPIVIAQHLPAAFTSRLAERLNTFCALNVVQASDGTMVEQGNVYVCPGSGCTRLKTNHHRVVVDVQADPKPEQIRPSVDQLFASAASVWRGRTCAIILTGMGRDGQKGAEAVFQAGGSVIAQDKESSVVWGMPGAVVESGMATHVFGLTDIRDALIRFGQAKPNIFGPLPLQYNSQSTTPNETQHGTA